MQVSRSSALVGCRVAIAAAPTASESVADN
jgi:hypothetical protein